MLEALLKAERILASLELMAQVENVVEESKRLIEESEKLIEGNEAQNDS